MEGGQLQQVHQGFPIFTMPTPVDHHHQQQQQQQQQQQENHHQQQQHKGDDFPASSLPSSNGNTLKYNNHNSHNESDSLHSGSLSSDLEECTSNSDDCSKTNPKRDDDKNDNGEQKLQLATKETQAVFRLRLIVLFVLLIASLAVSLIVYNITSNSLEKQTSSDFDGAAKKVTETFLEIAETKIGALASFAVAVIANSLDLQQDWPFVTLSNFQQRAATARSQSGALNLMLVPLVDTVERAQWQQFVQNQSSWL